MKNLLQILLIVLMTASAASAAPRDFPRPEALGRDVAVWKRIYSEVGTNAGLLHDSRKHPIVYEVITIPTGPASRSPVPHTEKRLPA